MNKYANQSKQQGQQGQQGQQNSMQSNVMGNQNQGQMQSSAQIDQNIENYKKQQQKNSLQ